MSPLAPHQTLVKIPSGGYFTDIGNISRISAFETIPRDFSGVRNFRVADIQTPNRDVTWRCCRLVTSRLYSNYTLLMCEESCVSCVLSALETVPFWAIPFWECFR